MCHRYNKHSSCYFASNTNINQQATLYVTIDDAHFICLSVSVKRLAVKTASEMTYTVSGGALNSAQPQPSFHT